MTGTHRIEGNVENAADAFYLMNQLCEYLCDEEADQMGRTMHVSVEISTGPKRTTEPTEL